MSSVLIKELISLRRWEVQNILRAVFRAIISHCLDDNFSNFILQEHQFYVSAFFLVSLVFTMKVTDQGSPGIASTVFVKLELIEVNNISYRAVKNMIYFTQESAIHAITLYLVQQIDSSIERPGVLSGHLFKCSWSSQ